MILTLPVRGIEREIEVEWDMLPLAFYATCHLTFVDDLPPVELTEAERVEIESEAGERAWVAAQARQLEDPTMFPKVLRP